MGLNIMLKKINQLVITEGYGCNEYYDTTKLEWFDSLRYSGDKEFVSQVEFQYYNENTEEGYDYYKPVNLDTAEAWIKENIYENLQPRLLQAINEMRKDKDIVFRFSW